MHFLYILPSKQLAGQAAKEADTSFSYFEYSRMLTRDLAKKKRISKRSLINIIRENIAMGGNIAMGSRNNK